MNNKFAFNVIWNTFLQSAIIVLKIAKAINKVIFNLILLQLKILLEINLHKNANNVKIASFA